MGSTQNEFKGVLDLVCVCVCETKTKGSVCAGFGAEVCLSIYTNWSLCSSPLFNGTLFQCYIIYNLLKKTF